MTTDISDQTDAATESRQEAAWARMEELARRASEAASTQALASQGEERKRPRRPRRRLFVVVTSVAVLVAAAAGALVVVRDVHGRTPTSAPAPHSATVVDAVPLETATADALAAVKAEREGLAHLAGVPTPANVAPVTDAYAASLRLYRTLLATTPVPAGAKAVALAAQQQVGIDATRLQGVAALPPLLLGAFLEDTTARATHLEGVLRTLQHELAAPTR